MVQAGGYTEDDLAREMEEMKQQDLKRQAAA